MDHQLQQLFYFRLETKGLLFGYGHFYLEVYENEWKINSERAQSERAELKVCYFIKKWGRKLAFQDGVISSDAHGKPFRPMDRSSYLAIAAPERPSANCRKSAAELLATLAPSDIESRWRRWCTQAIFEDARHPQRNQNLC
jgi:hypothetical protein